MKTVMKKMFSLLLVAVMLVGIMPFQAFADGESATVYVYEHIAGGEGNTLVNTTSVMAGETSADGIAALVYTGTVLGASAIVNDTTYVGSATFTVSSGATVALFLEVPAPEPETLTCETCKDTYTKGTTHTCETLTCETCKDTYTKGTTHTCETLTCETCKDTYTKGTTHTCETLTCEICKGTYTKGTSHTCRSVMCPTCKDTYTMDQNHTCATLTCETCKETYTKGTSHVSGCPYCTECLKKGDKNTSHTATAHCTVCGVANGHATNCSNVTYPATGNAKLYVWADLVVGTSEKQTILLDTIEGLSGSDLIYQVIARNESRLRSKIPNGYGWTGHVYYEQDPKTELTVKSTMTVADDDDVVINLYADEKLVVARVHTGKYYTVDRLIDVGGFQVGDTVTSADVLKAVKKHYNVSSMKMYTPSDWEKIVTGGSASTIPNFTVTNGDNIVDVYVTGSRISSSGTSYTADSTNPKTGDTIFAPIAIMGLSVSALAVLFFLNKKRAY